MISTTKLAKIKEISTKEMFDRLKSKGWIYKKDKQWQLTKNGRIAGGELIYKPKYGEYIVWPENMDINKEVSSNQLLNATKMGEHFKISNRKINLYLSETGWIEKKLDGWKITKTGIENGGVQMETTSGVPYVLWDDNILNNKFLVRAIKIGEVTYNEHEDLELTEKQTKDFRLEFPATKRTSDGHYVRSRGEQLIDNFFYRNGISHAYEKKLNIEDEMYCDFYLPTKNVYIEYWGLDENKKYLDRKKRKLELYAKNGFKLIEINNSDIDNLEEVLQTKLRKIGIVIH